MTRYRCPTCGGNQYSSNPNRAHEACIYCGNKGTEIMKNLEPENDESTIKRITKEQASEIIETRTQTGRFYTKESVNIRRSRGSSIWLSAETIKAIDKQLDELKEESAEP